LQPFEHIVVSLTQKSGLFSVQRFPLIALASLLAVSFYVSVCATTKKYCILFELHVQLRHMLPSEEAFAAGCSALGIENNDGVVVYDGMGLFSAARVWW